MTRQLDSMWLALLLLSACSTPAGGFGAACSGNDQCASALCVNGSCSSACATDCDCPSGHACSAVRPGLSVCTPGAGMCTRGMMDAGMMPMCAARETACTGGRDEDCDGAIDCADADCVSSPACEPACRPSPENTSAACTNGTDDDCDGTADCADADCRAAGVDACFGDYVDSDCASLSGRAGTWSVRDLQVERTARGLRTLLRIPGEEFVEVELDIAMRSTGEVDLQTPPNDYRRTCTDCVVLRRASRTYFQRRGTLTITRMPSAIGEVLEGTLAVEFDESRVGAGGELDPVRGGTCLYEVGSFSGVVVSGGVTGRGTGSIAPSGGGLRQRAPQPPVCGDGYCEASEDSANCAADCGCGATDFTRACPGGHLCPSRGQCVSRGRCACPLGSSLGPGLSGVACDTRAACGAGTCTGGPTWTCVYSTGCGGEFGYSVPCAGGVWCPASSTCIADGRCMCDPGLVVQQCDPTCTGPGFCEWGCRPSA